MVTVVVGGDESQPVKPKLKVARSGDRPEQTRGWLGRETGQNKQGVAKQQLKTSRAWGFKDYFRWFWMSPDSTAAREFFDDWYA